MGVSNDYILKGKYKQNKLKLTVRRPCRYTKWSRIKCKYNIKVEYLFRSHSVMLT